MVVFLIMPARERTLNYEHNQEMQSYTDKLNLANQETDKLKLQVEDYQKQKEDAEGQLNDLKGDSGSTVNQYAALAKTGRVPQRGYEHGGSDLCGYGSVEDHG